MGEQGRCRLVVDSGLLHTSFTRHAIIWIVGLGHNPENRPMAPSSPGPQFLEGNAEGMIDLSPRFFFCCLEGNIVHEDPALLASQCHSQGESLGSARE